MIYVGNPGFIFKRKNKNTLYSFNGKFNVILQTDTSILHKDRIENLSYIVPLVYKEFLTSEKLKNKKPHDIFTFKNKDELQIFNDFVLNLK